MIKKKLELGNIGLQLSNPYFSPYDTGIVCYYCLLHQMTDAIDTVRWYKQFQSGRLIICVAYLSTNKLVKE